jgi:hypothetical protein
MNSIYLDLILSGLTYVILTYLSFMLMKKRKARTDNGDNEGGIFNNTHPKIDLPPGVCWPNSPKVFEKIEEEVY